MVHIQALSQEDNISNLTSYIYLHGVLQDQNGYDLVYIRDLPDERGVYEADVTLSDGSHRTAHFYRWFDGDKDRGLIVDTEDVDGNSFAMEKFNENMIFL